MESEPPPFRFLSMPEPCLPGLCLHPPGWWQRENHTKLLMLVSSGQDRQSKDSSSHISIVPCSVKAEPLKATRYLSQPTEDILGSSQVTVWAVEPTTQGPPLPGYLFLGGEGAWGLSKSSPPHPTPTGVISIGPFVKVEDPTPLSWLGETKVTKTNVRLPPNLLDAGVWLLEGLVGRCLPGRGAVMAFGSALFRGTWPFMFQGYP